MYTNQLHLHFFFSFFLIASRRRSFVFFVNYLKLALVKNKRLFFVPIYLQRTNLLCVCVFKATFVREIKKKTTTKNVFVFFLFCVRVSCTCIYYEHYGCAILKPARGRGEPSRESDRSEQVSVTSLSFALFLPFDRQTDNENNCTTRVG